MFSGHWLQPAVCLLRRACRAVHAFDSSGLTVLLVAALLLTVTTASAPPNRVHATGAVGIVVRHSDGRVLYAYIPLTAERITGAEVLQQAGFPLNVQASSSLGAAVCKIDGEGCDAPKEDCFCKSYGNPAFYWHYYTRGPSGEWRTSNTGAGNRVLRDGDVDGWSWTANDPALPVVTLDEIAALVRPAATAIPTPLASIALPTATPLPMRAPAVTDVPLITTAVLTDAASPSSPTASPIAEIRITPLPPIVPPTRSIHDDDPTPRAVIVAPGGTITPVQPVPMPRPESGGGVGAFAIVAVLVLLLLTVVPLGARRRRGMRGTQGNASGTNGNDETYP